jgi:hypothetical protein
MPYKENFFVLERLPGHLCGYKGRLMPHKEIQSRMKSLRALQGNFPPLDQLPGKLLSTRPFNAT